MDSRIRGNDALLPDIEQDIVMQQHKKGPMITAEKIQKVLARLGLGSRREIEQWIAAGRITLNGQTAELGARVTEADHICVDGQKIKLKISAKAKIPRMILYHKPEGEICTRDDPEDRSTVFERLPPLTEGRWVMVGRLDLNTAGLLLFTNDGELAHRLMHPSFNQEREYAVRVLGEVSPEILARLRQGVMIDKRLSKFIQLKKGGGDGANTWYHVILTEGRHRLVRRLWESQGITVSRLIRTRYGSITLPRDLPRGEWVELSTSAVQRLIRTV